MSSFYDEDPHATTGRASVPGPSADPDGGLAGESYEPIAEPVRSNPAPDRPSPNGRGTVGRASVRSAVLSPGDYGPEGDFDPFDESPSATVSGRAAVPMPGGPMPTGPMPGGPSM